MKTRTLVALCMAGLLPLFAGCEPSEKVVAVTAGNNGQTVKAAVGNQLVLSLESNPSTGFSWKITAIDPTILKQAGEPALKSAPGAAGKVGAGRTLIWTFDVKAVGSTPLTLEYRRSWEPDSVPAAQAFTVTVEATK